MILAISPPPIAFDRGAFRLSLPYTGIRQSKLSREEKDRLIETARLLDANEVMLSDNHQIIKCSTTTACPRSCR